MLEKMGSLGSSWNAARADFQIISGAKDKVSMQAPFITGSVNCEKVAISFRIHYASQYREKHQEQCEAWYKRKKAGRLAQRLSALERKKPVRKPRFTEEERKSRNLQRSYVAFEFGSL